MKFLVVQIGARRGYAVPKILERAGLLERFYSDVAGNIGAGKLLPALKVIPGLRNPAGRLAARKIPTEVLSRSRTFSGSLLLRSALGRLARLTPERAYRNSVAYSLALGNQMVKAGFGNATHVYSMMGECSPVLQAAREKGLRVVSEVYIIQSAKMLLEDLQRFPGWQTPSFDFERVHRELFPVDPLFAFSDYFICPSEAVRDDLVKNFAVKSAQCAVVPYGMNPELLSVRNEPVRGRVLFAGTADLRKGIHYFAQAAEKVSGSGKGFEFRVAGNVQPRVAQQSVCRHLNFLGRVPRADMAREFAAADVFVLPSLAEGSAEVTYEALACGVPVVTTPEAGSVVRDGVEGRIVPSRDPEALAGAIVEIIEDREKRERMAYAARERARDYTWERYGERLVAALRAVHV